MKRNEIYKTYSKDYEQATYALLQQSNLEQHILEKGLGRELRIGIKPNLVSPTPAEYGATTHPEVVRGIISYLQDHAFSNLVMVEGSWIGDKTSESYEYCGYQQISEDYQVPFVDTQKEDFHPVDCKGLTLQICDVVDTIDFLINVPVLKGHGQTKITCALKNMKGLIPNSEKRHFHTMGLHKPIAHLSVGIHQDFIVIDHICGDLDFEDGGNPVVRDCIMTSMDPVLVDSYVCRLLGYEKEQVPYVVMAEELGSGSGNLKESQILVWQLDEGLPQDSQEKNMCLLGTYSGEEEDPGEENLRPGEKVLEISYAIDDADSCSACYASLAPALYRLKEEGILEGELPFKIAIGQGHQGETGEYGIGKCCKGYTNHVWGCPPEEETVYAWLKELLEKR